MAEQNQDVRALLAAWGAAQDDAARNAIRDRLIVQGVGVLPALLAALDDAEPDIRRGAIWALAQMVRGNITSAASILAERCGNVLLLDADPHVRAAAAEALRLAPMGSQYRQALEALVTALGDDHPLVRKTAALALGNKLERRATDDLARLVLTDPNEKVRGAAAAALAHMDYAAVANLGDPALTALLTELNDPEVPPTYAIRALGILCETRAVEPLIRLLETDARPRTRLEACKALGRIKDTRALAALEHIAGDDPDETVCAAAVEALRLLREEDE